MTMEQRQLEAAAQVEALHAALVAARNPARAASEKAYLESDLEFLGVPVPIIRWLAADFSHAHHDLDHADLLTLVGALWQTPTHELHAVGIALLERYRMRLEASDLTYVEEMLRRSSTWEYVDWLSIDVA